MTVLYFIIALGVLVFIHEFGHFILAKKQGIGVEKFSLGFGPKLLSFQRGETTYLISALPLGGYVKLHGEDPDSPESQDPQDKRSYARRPIHQRAGVVLAGPLMNLLLALLLMPTVFMIGRMEPVFFDQKPVVIGIKKESSADQAGLKKGDEVIGINEVVFKNWKDYLDFVLLHGKEEVDLKFKRGEHNLTKRMTIEESPETHAGMLGIEPSYFIGNEAVVDEVSPGSAAEVANLKAGDEILKVDQVTVESWTDMSEKVGKSEGRKIAITVRRGEEILNVFVVPRFDPGMKKWLMGVRKNADRSGDAFVNKKYPLGEAILEGTRENLKLSGLTLSVLKRLVTFQLSYKTLGGPIRIAQASALAAKSGLSDFLYFLAFLSLQLGLLNLLPMPVLDGGHLLFFGIEGVARRPLPMKIRGYAEQAGFILLMTLMLLVTLNDIESVWGIRQILEKIRGLF